MSELDVFKIESGTYGRIPFITKIFGTAQINYTLYVALPKHLCPCVTPIEIVEIKDELPNPVDIFSDCKWVQGHPWIDIPWSSLNQDEGQHLYRISFIDVHTDTVMYLYFSYIVQNDNPEKPYVYMNKEECSCATSNS